MRVLQGIVDEGWGEMLNSGYRAVFTTVGVTEGFWKMVSGVVTRWTWGLECM